MHVVVRFAASSLKTTNAALDLTASAQRYRDALETALRAALPAHTVEVMIDPTASSLTVSTEEPDTALGRAIERDVLDHAWVVRQMSDWTVVG